jgi:hypothetical protein
MHTVWAGIDIYTPVKLCLYKYVPSYTMNFTSESQYLLTLFNPKFYLQFKFQRNPLQATHMDPYFKPNVNECKNL